MSADDLEEMLRRVVREERATHPAALDEDAIKAIAKAAAEEVMIRALDYDPTNPRRTRDAVLFAISMQEGARKTLWHGFLAIIASGGLFIAAKFGLPK